MTIHHLPLTIEFFGTPGSGKTTAIHRLEKVLSEKYVTLINQESAELVPSFLNKHSFEGHFWMKLKTYENALEKQYYPDDYDVLLIDRGIVDSLFWDYYYSKTGILDSDQVNITKAFLKSMRINLPDLVVFLETSPEEAINRRGGEGHLVTLDFLKDFNNSLHLFIGTVPCPVFPLDTSGLSIDEVTDTLLKEFAKI